MITIQTNDSIIEIYKNSRLKVLDGGDTEIKKEIDVLKKSVFLKKVSDISRNYLDISMQFQDVSDMF